MQKEINDTIKELETLLNEDIEAKKQEIEIAERRRSIRKRLQMARQRIDSLMLDVA